MNIAKKILCYCFYGVLLTAMGLAAVDAIGVAFTFGGETIWYQIFCFVFNVLGILAALIFGIYSLKKAGQEDTDNRKLNNANSILALYLIAILLSYFVYMLLLLSNGQTLPISMMCAILVSMGALTYSLLIPFDERPLAKCIGAGVGYLLFLAAAIVELGARKLAGGFAPLVGYSLILLALAGLGMNVVYTIAKMIKNKAESTSEEPKEENPEE